MRSVRRQRRPGNATGSGKRAAPIACPLANVVHLLGLVMLVGGIGLLDLRLVGAYRALPIVSLSRALTPIAIVGLILMIPSGLTMVAADAAVAESATFRWKLLLIAIALANALASPSSGAIGSRIGTHPHRPRDD